MSRIPNFADVAFEPVASPSPAGNAEPWLTPEGIPVKPTYGEADLAGVDFLDTWPGIAPFLRGPYPTMYVNQPWTIRQYAGFSTAEASNAFYRRNLAAGQMGSWEWDIAADRWTWDEGQHRIFGVEPGSFQISAEAIRHLIHHDDQVALRQVVQRMSEGERTQRIEFRVCRPNGELRWCMGAVAASVDAAGKVERTVDDVEREMLADLDADEVAIVRTALIRCGAALGGVEHARSM